MMGDKMAYPPKKCYHSIKHRSLDVKIKLAQNRIKALESEIVKKQTLVDEIKMYLQPYLDKKKFNW